MRVIEETPVLIVGGGPVGLALAGALGWRGIPCVETTASRSDNIGVRTIEFCRRWGIVDRVEMAPPKDEPLPPRSPQHRERQP